MVLKRIISGAQTGSERAALDSAIDWRVLSWGGWVPKGRLADDGRIPSYYFPYEEDAQNCASGLEETSAGRNHKAAALNARSSDATLILRYHRGGRVLSQGTKLLLEMLMRLEKPYRILEPATRNVSRAARWICEARVTDESDVKRGIEVLNVSGPCESANPGIYKDSMKFFEQVFGLVHLFDRYGARVWASEDEEEEY